jgi:hypothetical protein
MKNYVESTGLLVYQLLSLLNPKITTHIVYNVTLDECDDLLIIIIHNNKRYSVTIDNPELIKNELYHIILF